MSFQQQREKIKSICKALLDDKRVELILGFTQGELENSSAPFFITKSEELESLKWDNTCTPNLARYLPESKVRTAIVAKPCDSRAIAMYLAEKQLKREDLFIIGVECCRMTGRDGREDPACTRCEVKKPTVYDVIVEKGDDMGVEGKAAKIADDQLSGDKFENLKNELKKCILCFSCRQACYGCYCQTCFIDRNIPNWLPLGPDLSTKMVFHLGRAMHLAGRCVDCGACERACPSGVKLHYLVSELNKLCKELYDYTPGMDPDETPAMLSFGERDREIGFLGGEGNE